jgi:hypothetical protein
MNFKLRLLALVMLTVSPAWAGWTFVTKDLEDNSFFVVLLGITSNLSLKSSLLMPKR